MFSSALQMVVSEIDVFFSDVGESDIFSFLAAIFGFIMTLVILVIVFFPEKIHSDFEEIVATGKMKIYPEDD
ncbi:MAG: hypothetical protein ACFFD4_02095 [Candidatus Odinarchaeota archaeon]